VTPRLIFISERYPPDLGGVATSAGRISRAIAEMGVAVDVIAWTRSLQPGVVVEEKVEENSAKNHIIYRIGRFREWDSTLPHTLNLVDWLMSIRSAAAIWGHYLTPAGFLAGWIGRMKRLPSAVSVRGNDLDREMFPPGDFARLEWTLQHATCITAVTKELACKVEALSGRTDVCFMRNVVDHGTFKPLPCDDPCVKELRGKLGIGEQEAVLGFSGELREKKGLQYLLAALRHVRETRPACILVIGEVRPSEIVKVMQSIGPGSLQENRILVTGQLSTPADVNLHLQLCDVYLQPSLWDGMPNALLEAMAAGCGCIASDAGGIPEVISPGVDGIIVPRWQLHRLSEAVLEWLGADVEHRTRIRRAARDRILGEFTYAAENRVLQDIIARLMPSRS